MNSSKAGRFRPFSFFFSVPELDRYVRSVSSKEFSLHCPLVVLACLESLSRCSDEIRQHRHVKAEGLDSRISDTVVIQATKDALVKVLRNRRCVMLGTNGRGQAAFGQFGGLDQARPYKEMQGYNVLSSHPFRLAFEHLQVSEKLVQCQRALTKSLGHAHICVHVRRRNFKKHALLLFAEVERLHQGPFPFAAYWQEVPDMAAAAEGTGDVFVATDEPAVLVPLRDALGTSQRVLSSADVPCMADLSNGQASLLEQRFCSETPRFVGNRFSAWSSTVYNLRRLAGLTATEAFPVRRNRGLKAIDATAQL